MKKLTYAILLFICIPILFGQKDKRIVLEVNYFNLPKQVQNKEFNTYTYEIKSSRSLEYMNVSKEQLISKLDLEAFTPVEKGVAENHIIFTIGGYGNLNPSLKTSKSSDGTKTFYSYSYDFNLNIISVLKEGGTTLNRTNTKPFVSSSSQGATEFHYKSKTFTSSSEAKKYWSNSGRNEFRSIVEKAVLKKWDEIVIKTKKDIDYFPTSERVDIKYIKTTKKADYSEYEEKAYELKAALESINSTDDRSAFTSSTESLAAFYDNILTPLDPDDKKMKTFFEVCGVNLFHIYYYRDDMVVARKYLDIIGNIKGYGILHKLYKKKLDQREKSLKDAETYGINPYTGISPATAEELAQIQHEYELKQAELKAIRDAELEEMRIKREIAMQKIAPKFNEYSGYYINRKGEQIDATFRFYTENAGKKNFRTFVYEGHPDGEVRLSNVFATYAKVGNYEYKEVEFFDGDRWKSGLLKVAFSSPKISVYSRISVHEDNNSYSRTIYYQKPDQKKTTNTNLVTFLAAYKKSMQKYFEDCPEMVKRIEEKTYKFNPDSKIIAAKDYAHLCE